MPAAANLNDLQSWHWASWRRRHRGCRIVAEADVGPDGAPEAKAITSKLHGYVRCRRVGDPTMMLVA
jgi:hypothetical protein